jgi:hypothetical protein
VIAAVVVAGCGSVRRFAQPATRAASSSAAPAPPLNLTARRLTARHSPFTELKPGTRVPRRVVDAPAFADSDHGFGLANLSDGETFPARTTDGGRTWQIDGPVFHVPAADGPAGVSYAGIASPRIYFAYGSSVVDVTTNSGKSWWQAGLGELVLAVVAQQHQLVAVVQHQTSATSQSLTSVSWVYVSRDGGRHWRYDSRLGAS